MSEPFRFMDLPTELRLKVYRIVLPHSTKLILDPENVHTPSPFQEAPDYGEIFNLLLVCKEVSAEVIPLLFSSNTLSVIETSGWNALDDFGPLSCANIVSVEFMVSDGLSDLAPYWFRFVEEFVSLQNLRLIFYHKTDKWLDSLAELALAATVGGNPLVVELELYESVWAPPFAIDQYQHMIQESFELADRRLRMYTVCLPEQVRKISVAASVGSHAFNAFLGYQYQDKGCEFNRNRVMDTDFMKCLVWEEVGP